LLEICRSHPELLQAANRSQPDVIVCGLIRRNRIEQDSRTADDGSLGAILGARIVNRLAHQAVKWAWISEHYRIARAFRECLPIAARGELWMESSLTMNC
jgi:hypothetical protein